MSRLGFVGGVALGATLAAVTSRWVEGRRTVNQHVEDYKAHWDERRREDGVIRYVALGDSAAQGVGASRVERSYVSLVADRLRTATDSPVVVTNLSVSGATSDDVVRDQLPLLAELEFTPDLVTLDIGGNDVVFPGHTPSTFEASLGRILEALPAGSFVADVPWFMVPGMARQSRQMAQVAAVLIEQHGHHLVPLHRVSRETGMIGYHRFTAKDFFHPNDAGYQGWADTFWSEIEESGHLEALQA